MSIVKLKIKINPACYRNGFPTGNDLFTIDDSPFTTSFTSKVIPSVSRTACAIHIASFAFSIPAGIIRAPSLLVVHAFKTIQMPAFFASWRAVIGSTRISLTFICRIPRIL